MRRRWLRRQLRQLRRRPNLRRRHVRRRRLHAGLRRARMRRRRLRRQLRQLRRRPNLRRRHVRRRRLHAGLRRARMRRRRLRRQCGSCGDGQTCDGGTCVGGGGGGDRCAGPTGICNADPTPCGHSATGETCGCELSVEGTNFCADGANPCANVVECTSTNGDEAPPAAIWSASTSSVRKPSRAAAASARRPAASASPSATTPTRSKRRAGRGRPNAAATLGGSGVRPNSARRHLVG